MDYIKAIIVSGGMGSFLTPPDYPEQKFEVQTDLRRQPKNRGGMCLSAAVTCEYLSPEFRAKVKALLDDWNKTKPQLNDIRVINWIMACVAHLGEDRAIKYVQKYYPSYGVQS